MIIRYIFKNGTEYLHAWQNCIDRMIGNKELDREIHSKENGVDYDFAVSLYSSLVAQKDLFGSPAPEVIIDAAMRCGFMIGRAYDVTIPEDIPKPTPPRRSRRPSRKTAPKPTAQKDGTDNEK